MKIVKTLITFSILFFFASCAKEDLTEMDALLLPQDDVEQLVYSNENNEQITSEEVSPTVVTPNGESLPLMRFDIERPSIVEVATDVIKPHVCGQD